MIKSYIAAIGILGMMGAAVAGIPPADFPGDLPGAITLVEEQSLQMRIPGRYLPRAGDRFLVVREDGQKQIHVIARGKLTTVEGVFVQGACSAETGFKVSPGDRVVVHTSLPPAVISEYGFASMPVDDAAEKDEAAIASKETDPSMIVTTSNRVRSEAADKGERLYREALRLTGSQKDALLRQAADSSHPEAALELSRSLFKSRSIEEAKLRLRRAAELGSVEAQFLLGDSWAGSGFSVFEKNIDRALQWYDKAGEIDPQERARRLKAIGILRPD